MERYSSLDFHCGSCAKFVCDVRLRVAQHRYDSLYGGSVVAGCSVVGDVE